MRKWHIINLQLRIWKYTYEIPNVGNFNSSRRPYLIDWIELDIDK